MSRIICQSNQEAPYLLIDRLEVEIEEMHRAVDREGLGRALEASKKLEATARAMVELLEADAVEAAGGGR